MVLQEPLDRDIDVPVEAVVGALSRDVVAVAHQVPSRRVAVLAQDFLLRRGPEGGLLPGDEVLRERPGQPPVVEEAGAHLVVGERARLQGDHAAEAGVGRALVQVRAERPGVLGAEALHCAVEGGEAGQRRERRGREARRARAPEHDELGRRRQTHDKVCLEGLIEPDAPIALELPHGSGSRRRAGGRRCCRRCSSGRSAVAGRGGHGNGHEHREGAEAGGQSECGGPAVRRPVADLSGARATPRGRLRGHRRQV